jgi:hypothetical protein
LIRLRLFSAALASVVVTSAAIWGCSADSGEDTGQSEDHLTNTLKPGEVAGLLRKVGFAENVVGKMVCTAKYESSFNAAATHTNGNGTTDYGLFQINSVHAGKGVCPNATGLLSPEPNTRCALQIFKSQGIGAWAAYTAHKAECDAYPAPASIPLGADAGMDASKDSGKDAAKDSGMDAAKDGGTNAAKDGGKDSGSAPKDGGSGEDASTGLDGGGEQDSGGSEAIPEAPSSSDETTGEGENAGGGGASSGHKSASEETPSASSKEPGGCSASPIEGGAGGSWLALAGVGLVLARLRRARRADRE